MRDNTKMPTEVQIAQRTFLRVKIRHLALEPLIIKHEIGKARESYAKWREREFARKIEANETVRLDVQSYGSSTALLQKYVPYASPWAAIRLREHHIKETRPEARAAQVAYAFIRGKAYLKTERPVKSFPDWNRVTELALKYGGFPDGTSKKEALQSIMFWADRPEEKTEQAA